MNMPKLNNSDILENGWWSIFPKSSLKWIRLGRFDRPIGFWLLLLPGWWVLPLTSLDLITCIKLMFIFFIGSIVMRAAGCTINDLWDKDIDKKISRTKNRPLANGEISNLKALYFLILMLLIGFFCLYQLNVYTWFVAIAAIPLVIIYPLAKRFTKWPQFVLGITFSWGVPTAWAATNADFNIGLLFLYVGTVFWIIGYDTIYGYQDKFEDKILNIHNTAITAENYLTNFMLFFYMTSILSFLFAGLFLKIHLGWYIGLFFMFIHFIIQIRKLKIIDRYEALKLFKSNKNAGIFLTIGSLSKFLNLV